MRTCVQNLGAVRRLCRKKVPFNFISRYSDVLALYLQMMELFWDVSVFQTEMAHAAAPDKNPKSYGGNHQSVSHSVN